LVQLVVTLSPLILAATHLQLQPSEPGMRPAWVVVHSRPPASQLSGLPPLIFQGLLGFLWTGSRFSADEGLSRVGRSPSEDTERSGVPQRPLTTPVASGPPAIVE
jgi:hypothetical protein